MKLLLITCIEEFENDVKEILKHSGVKAFSYQSVRGYKNGKDAGVNNWFITADPPVDSMLFIAFIEDNCVDDIFFRAEKFNTGQSAQSRLHLTVINAARSL